MSEKIDFNKEFEASAKLTWKWLRQRGEYKKAFNEQMLCWARMKRYKTEKKRREILQKHESQTKNAWGFYPLGDYRKRKPPLNLKIAMLDLIKRTPGDGVILMNVDESLLKKLTMKKMKKRKVKRRLVAGSNDRFVKPNTLIVNIDFTQPDKVITESLKKKLARVRSLFGVKPKRVAPDQWAKTDMLYKTFVLENLNYKPSRIREEIFGKKDKYPDQTYQKRTERVRRKVKRKADA